MAKRREWTFEYPADAVADGAEERAEYHRSREAHWNAEVGSAKKTIQEAGIDLRSFEVTGGQRHEVVLDPTLANRLSEAQGKAQGHRKDAEDFMQWERVLRANPHDRLALHYDDVDYFGLAA